MRKSITLYPNPAKNTLVVDGSGDKISGTLMLVDGSGRIVIQRNVSAADNIKINVSGLPLGVYVYKLDDLKGTFIKQ